MSYCIEVTDKGMKSLGYLEELSDLELRGLDKITGVGLTALVTRCKRLTYLDLKHCEKIDDSGFQVLAYYSQNLRQVLNRDFNLELLFLLKYLCFCMQIRKEKKNARSSLYISRRRSQYI